MSKNNRYRFSIIVATFNRLEELKELLGSFEKCTFPTDDYEILISDDGSSDGTKEYIEHASFSVNVRYLYQVNKGPGEARNHGMRESDADYFIFMDSDCMIPPDYLQNVESSLVKNQWDAFGGPDTYHPSFSSLLKAVNYSMTSMLGTGGTRGSAKSVTKFYPRSFNMGISRKVYERIGGMTDLRHGQDMDFSMRIYRAGFKVGLISDAIVYHKRRTSLKRFFKQVFNWGVARINLGNTYREYWKPVHFLPLILLWTGIIIVIFSLFSVFFRFLFGIGLLGLSLLSIIAFFQASWEYRSIKVGFLSVVTLIIQVLAYALGSTSGLWQLVIGKEEAKGFSRNYYK